MSGATFKLRVGVRRNQDRSDSFVFGVTMVHLLLHWSVTRLGLQLNRQWSSLRRWLPHPFVTDARWPPTCGMSAILKKVKRKTFRALKRFWDWAIQTLEYDVAATVVHMQE